MHIQYDPKADAMRIKFSLRPTRYTETVTDLVIVHFAEDRTPVSIELLRVSTYTDGVDDVIARYSPTPAHTD